MDVSPNMVYTPDGQIGFVAFTGSDVVLAFRPDTAQIVRAIAVGSHPVFLVFTPDFRSLLVVNVGSLVHEKEGEGDGISVIDVGSLSVVRTISFEKVDFGFGSNLVLTRDGQFGFLSSTGTHEVVKFRVSDGSEVGRARNLFRPAYTALSPDDGTLAVVNTLGNFTERTAETVVFLSSADLKVQTTFVAPDLSANFVFTNQVVFTSDGSKALVTNVAQLGGFDEDDLFVINVSDGKLVKKIPAGADPSRILLTPDGKKFIVVSRSSLTVLNAESLEGIFSVAPPFPSSFQSTTGVAFSPDSSLAYVSSPSDDSLFTIDLTTSAITTQTRVGDDPDEAFDEPLDVAVTPDGTRVTVLNFRSNKIDVVVESFARHAPLAVLNAETFSGFAVSNPGEQAAEVTLTFVADVGAPFVGTDAVNPVKLTLGPGEQVSRSLNEWFNLQEPAETQEDGGPSGWIFLDSDRPGIQLLFVKGDRLGNGLDALQSVGTPLREIFFSKIAHSEQFFTELDIVNPNFNTDQFDLEAFNAFGDRIGASMGNTISGRTRIKRRLDQFFPDLQENLRGWIRIRSNMGLVAALVYGTADSLAVLPGRSLNESPNPLKLYSPHFVTGNGFRARLSLSNPLEEPFFILIRGFAPAGTSLGEVPFTLEPGHSFEAEVGELFGLDAVQLRTGWIEVESSHGSVIGHLEFSGPEFTFLTAVPLEGTSRTRIAFPQVAQNDDFSTGIALLNSNDQAATVTLRILDTAGALTGERIFTLAPREQQARLLTEFVPGFGSQTGGQVQIRSSLPLVALEIFFSNELRFLASVLPE